MSKLENIRRIGYMDSTAFQHELGLAPKGNRVFPSVETCKAAHPCIGKEEFCGDHIDCGCEATRVYVFDADEFDKLLA